MENRKWNLEMLQIFLILFTTGTSSPLRTVQSLKSKLKTEVDLLGIL